MSLFIKIASIFLILCTILCLCACKSNISDESSDSLTSLEQSTETYTQEITSEPMIIKWAPYLSDSLFHEFDKEGVSFKLFVDAVLNYQSTVVFSTEEEMNNIYFAAWESFPLVGLIKYERIFNKKTIEITYLFSKEKHLQKIIDFKTKIEQIISECVCVGDSNLIAAMSIYKYISSNVVELEKYYSGDYAPADITSYHAIMMNEGISQSYSCAYNYLLRQLGIDSIIVNGVLDGEPHFWSLVNIGDEYFICDTQAESRKNGGNGLSYFGMIKDEIAALNVTGTLSSGLHNWYTQNIPFTDNTRFSVFRNSKSWNFYRQKEKLILTDDSGILTEINLP